MDMVPLSDAEILFCWRCLVDEGRLSSAKLQTFMKEVCGHNITQLQAKDMLQYMDANGDERVGMEDFRNFMSIVSLEQTDAKNFMWTPKAKYREENMSKHPKDDDDDANALGSWRTPTATGELWRPGRLQRGVDPANLSPPSLHPPGQAMSGELTPRRTPSEGTKERGKESRTDKPQKKKGGNVLKPKPQADATSVEPPPPSEPKEEVKARPKVPRVADNPKLLEKIESAISKYEKARWKELKTLEQESSRTLFKKYSGDADCISRQDYHKMLNKWFSLTQWAAPGSLRPSDSLATLEFLLKRYNERPTASSAPDAAAAGPAASGAGAGGAAAAAPLDPADAALTFGAWDAIMKGQLPQLPEVN